MTRPVNVVLIFGCTGCGKGAVGRELAARLNAEIISVDSMKIYRRMDIGTAKPGPEARAAIAHHLIDVAEPSETFSVGRFVDLADQAAAEISGRGHRVLAVGGTSLYIKSWTEGLFTGPSADEELRRELHARAEAEGSAVLHGELATVDPAAAQRIHPNDLRRIVRSLEVYRLTGTPLTVLQTQWDQDQPRPGFLLIGVRRRVDDQNRRTNARVRRMMDDGLLEEVRGLLAEDPPLATAPRQAVGYAEMIDHLMGGRCLADAVERVKINTRRLAKAQRTWCKRLRVARWVDVGADEPPEAVADRIAATL